MITYKIKIALSLLFVAIFSFEFEAQTAQLQNTAKKDSLVLKKLNSQKCVIVHSGKKVKLWLNDNQRQTGVLESFHEDTLTLLSNGLETKILVENIKKMKVYAGQFGKIVGGVFVVTGVGIMTFGAISLVAGTIAALNNDLGGIVLVAVPVLGGGGYGIYELGRRISGKKFNLESDKWSIQNECQ